MKKLFTILFIVSISTTFAQTIPSSDFETWEPSFNGGPEEPAGWTSFNSAMFTIGGLPSVTKVTSKFSGTYAANLRNVTVKFNGTDTIFGGLLYTDVDITGKPLPGYLKGHIKYSLQPGDVAIITFGYKSEDLDGSPIEYVIGIKKFQGISSSYIPFTIKTNAQYYPFRKSDVLTINISSYNYWTKNAVAISSQSNLTIDSLGFGGQSNPPTIVTGPAVSNGSFDNWYNVEGTKTPDNWFQGNLLQFSDTNTIAQSTDSRTGKYALKLGIDPKNIPAYVYTFIKPGVNDKYINGFSKFSLGSGDTVIAYLTKFTERDGLDGATIDSIIFTGNQDLYKGFSLKFNGKVRAGDTLALQFAAYNPIQFNNFRLEALSQFLIDDLSLGAFPLSILESFDNEQITISPNPSSSGIFNIQLNNEAGIINVSDILGNKVDANILKSTNGVSIDISKNPKGVYFVNLENTNLKSAFRIVY